MGKERRTREGVKGGGGGGRENDKRNTVHKDRQTDRQEAQKWNEQTKEAKVQQTGTKHALYCQGYDHGN